MPEGMGIRRERRETDRKKEGGKFPPLCVVAGYCLSGCGDRRFEGAFHALHIFGVSIWMKYDHDHSPLPKRRLRKGGCICAVSFRVCSKHLWRTPCPSLMLSRFHIHEPDGIDRPGSKPFGMDAYGIPTQVGCATGIWMWLGSLQ